MIGRVEIGIVGAGPAGARAAELLAAAGGDVVLWDPRAPWEKPCGGGLTAGTFRDIPELGEIRAHSRPIRLARIEAPGGAALEVPLHEPLYVVSRRRLSLWQLDRARRSGASLVSEPVRSVQPTRRGWLVTTADGQGTLVRLLVGADGAASRVRRATSPGLRPLLAPTRVAYHAHGDLARDAIVIRFAPGLDGYLWDFPRQDHRSVGIGVRRASTDRIHMDAGVDAFWREHGGDPGDPTGTSARAGAVIGTAAVPHARGYREIGGANWALLGDAAGFADPVTGEGIRNALRSAGLLAEAYRGTRSFASYPGRAEAAFERGFRLSRLVYRLVRDGALPSRLVRAGRDHPLLAAVLCLVVNASNDHRLRMSAWPHVWALRSASAGMKKRSPTPHAHFRASSPPFSRRLDSGFEPGRDR